MSLNELCLRFKEYAWNRHVGQEREVVAEYQNVGLEGDKPHCVVLKIINKTEKGERYTTLVALRPIDVKRLAAGFNYTTPETFQQEANTRKLLEDIYPKVKEVKS